MLAMGQTWRSVPVSLRLGLRRLLNSLRHDSSGVDPALLVVLLAAFDLVSQQLIGLALLECHGPAYVDVAEREVVFLFLSHFRKKRENFPLVLTRCEDDF